LGAGFGPAREILDVEEPEGILRWAANSYGDRLTMATGFGPEGCVILSMLATIKPDIRVINLDTGYQFPETLALRDRIRERYGIEVEPVRASESREHLEDRLGGAPYAIAPDECCRVNKVEPLRRALAGFDAWITGIRRSQTVHRAYAGAVEWDAKFGLVKVNPLATWTRQEVWAYIRINEVPYNPLHDQGYPSIGCWPCTHPVQPGGGERDGRWAHCAKTECGLHARS
jgi:phosphoadenosine phosphosulfate reductase